VVFSVEENDEERLLKRIFGVGRFEIGGHPHRGIESHFFTEGNEGVDQLRFVDTHVLLLMRASSVCAGWHLIGSARLSEATRSEEKSQRRGVPRKRAAGTNEGETQ